jgi:hypothetical protein
MSESERLEYNRVMNNNRVMSESERLEYNRVLNKNRVMIRIRTFRIQSCPEQQSCNDQNVKNSKQFQKCVVSNMLLCEIHKNT